MKRITRNKKGKQPIRPRRGPDGRWLVQSPEPEPPDDQEAAYAALSADRGDEAPITAGGLVIREPSPRAQSPTPLERTQPTPAPAAPVAHGEPEVTTQQQLVPIVVAPTASSPSRERPVPQRRTLIAVESITDEDAKPRSVDRLNGNQRPTPSEGLNMDPVHMSPSIGEPMAHSTANGAVDENTGHHSVSANTASIHASRFSRNSESLRRVLQEHAERAEARAQSAYEQNRAALDLISKSMDNVRGAFTEAKRARDQFHDILSVSSRSRQSVRQHAAATSPSVQQAEREAAGDIRKVAEYQR